MSSSYDWSSVILLPIIGAIVIGIIYTATLTKSVLYRIGAYLLSLVIIGITIYAIASSFKESRTTVIPNPSSSTTSTQDPFTYDPGESPNGTIVYPGNASSFISQYNCNLKSQNTVWLNNSCQCKPGFYGKSCEFEGFGDDYVSLTTNSAFTATLIPSTMTNFLTTWPLSTTLTGCTNLCTANSNCVAVTYANDVCTQISALRFTTTPIQNTSLDPPVSNTTLYINKSRLLSVDLPGYFDVIYGVLPVRYFVGNGVSQLATKSVHVTCGGTRIFYFPVGTQYTISGIPDYVIVGTAGILRISPNAIPPRTAIVPGQGTLVSIPTPVFMTRTEFPYTNPSITYYVRLDGP